MSEAAPVLFCHCVNAGIIPEEVSQGVYHRLAAAGVAMVEVADLCGLAARKDPALKRLVEAGGELRIAACFERAVRWLFARAGAELGESARVFNMRSGQAEAIASAMLAGRVAAEGAAPAPALASALGAKPDDDWAPWFPVIDYDRCTGCKQCMNFCIFGVYAAGPAGGVEVANPASCKTNCPACARICPSGAIIFPKYAQPDLIAGANVPAGPAGADLREKLRGDVYAVLRGRSGPGARGARPDGGSFDPARAESEKLTCICIAHQQGQLKVPLAVLRGLSAEEKVRLGLCGCDCDYEQVSAAACCGPSADPAGPCCPRGDSPGQSKGGACD